MSALEASTYNDAKLSTIQLCTVWINTEYSSVNYSQCELMPRVAV